MGLHTCRCVKTIHYVYLSPNCYQLLNFMCILILFPIWLYNSLFTTWLTANGQRYEIMDTSINRVGLSAWTIFLAVDKIFIAMFQLLPISYHELLSWYVVCFRALAENHLQPCPIKPFQYTQKQHILQKHHVISLFLVFAKFLMKEYMVIFSMIQTPRDTWWALIAKEPSPLSIHQPHNIIT